MHGRLDSAAQILHAATARQPGFLLARGYLAELALMRRDYEAARDTFDAYLRRAPRQPWALSQRGYAHGKLGLHNAAIADSIAAIDALPSSPSLLIELASRYIDAGKLIGAEDALRHAVERYPQEGRAYVRLCYVYLLQHNDEAAIAMCEKALQLATGPKRARDRAYAHLNLGQAHGRRGNLAAAFEHLEAAAAAQRVPLDVLERDPGLEALRADPRYGKLRTKRKSSR
jgi:tetratricopeptide (TPR) repeat protein